MNEEFQLLCHTLALITPQPWNDGSLAQSWAGGDSGTETRRESAAGLGIGQSAESKLRKWEKRGRCGGNSSKEMWLWLWKWDITVRVWQVVKCVTVTRIKWCDKLCSQLIRSGSQWHSVAALSFTLSDISLSQGHYKSNCDPSSSFQILNKAATMASISSSVSPSNTGSYSYSHNEM